MTLEDVIRTMPSYTHEHELAQAIRQWIDERLPKVPRAHTYASENADDYIMWEGGYEQALKDVRQSLGEE